MTTTLRAAWQAIIYPPRTAGFEANCSEGTGYRGTGIRCVTGRTSIGRNSPRPWGLDPAHKADIRRHQPSNRLRLRGAGSAYSGVVPEPDELTLEIMRALEIDRQWVRHFDPDDVGSISTARKAGRQAGRALKFKVVTFQTDPSRREDGRVMVIVASNQDETDPEEERRLSERTALLMRHAFGGQSNEPGDPKQG